MGKYTTKTGTNGEYYFNLVAGNGQVILSSQGYTTTSARDNGIASVQENGPKDERYERNTSTNDKFYFNLKASNGQVIGKSQMYENAAGCEKGIESVKTNAPSTTVEPE